MYIYYGLLKFNLLIIMVVEPHASEVDYLRLMGVVCVNHQDLRLGTVIAGRATASDCWYRTRCLVAVNCRVG